MSETMDASIKRWMAKRKTALVVEIMQDDLPPGRPSFIMGALGVVKRDPSLDRPGLEFPGFIGAAGRFGCRDLRIRSVPCSRSRRGVVPRCSI